MWGQSWAGGKRKGMLSREAYQWYKATSTTWKSNDGISHVPLKILHMEDLGFSPILLFSVSDGILIDSTMKNESIVCKE